MHTTKRRLSAGCHHLIPLGNAQKRARRPPPLDASVESTALERDTSVARVVDRAHDDVAVTYSDDEKSLNDFMRLHPMLSLEVTSELTLRMIERAKQKIDIVQRDLPAISKSYDDMFFEPADPTIGERDCACEARCICRALAQLRHGRDSRLAFVCKEFLLPSERQLFLTGGELPTRRRKCLMCTRYHTNYLYILARSHSSFHKDSFTASVVLPFCNSVGRGGVDVQHDVSRSGNLVDSSSVFYADDGYRPEAMLFVDEHFVDQSASSRQPPFDTLGWKPVVRFCCAHYRYEWSVRKRAPYVVQTGVGARLAHEPDRSTLQLQQTRQLFCRPSPRGLPAAMASVVRVETNRLPPA